MAESKPAPILQSSAIQFFQKLGWTIIESGRQVLEATKSVAGKELKWTLHFEDEVSFARSGSPSDFVQQVLNKASDCDFFDFIGTDRIFGTRRWTDEVRPIMERRLKEARNRQLGTWTNFLNRFALTLSTSLNNDIVPLLDRHFIRKPVRPRFADGTDAMRECASWLSEGNRRLMLVTGGPGAGKSVFALSLAQEIHSLFSRDPNRFPAPFLIWFSTERPPVLEDLISVTLQDLRITDLTVDAVKFLLSQGRIVFILDGFDEISRALAHRAEETIDKLSTDINKRTNGRLILTSRPAFLTQEQIYSELTTACEEDRPQRRDIAKYTDEQQREWIVLNSPDSELTTPPDRHWQRVQNAFHLNPWLRELCRTPVYLRMLSEVLVKETSIRSRDELVTKFCTGMWERERSKRTLVLSDAQYLLAYEAISAAIVDVEQIDPTDLSEWIAIYLGDDAAELLAEFPEDASTVIKDLAIGPLTGRGGHFVFEHEVLTGYFYARLLARNLRIRGKRFRELWNRVPYEPALAFLPEAINQTIGDKDKLLETLATEYRDGLLLWNIVKCFGSKVPQQLFRGKEVAGVIFENADDQILDLRNVSFQDCRLHDVSFVRCDLREANFQNAKFGRVKFVECLPGAIFDPEPIISIDSEVIVIRQPGEGEESYVGDDIRTALLSLAPNETKAIRLPSNMATQAAVVIFKSLFKSDKRTLDYPEPVKIENRLRAWLTAAGISEQERHRLLHLFTDMYREFEESGWISPNTNRPRTRMPAQMKAVAIFDIVRTEKIAVHYHDVREIVDQFEKRISRR